MPIMHERPLRAAGGVMFRRSIGDRLALPAIEPAFSRRPTTCHGSRILFYKRHSALSDSAASTVEQMYRHLIVFGKSGKHRANTLAAPVGFRDGHPVPMQNISSPIKTKK
jgi:hypothetical protein